ncbi:hypothetical protein MHYP_G00275590 [Metynnis hypsauchen]
MTWGRELRPMSNPTTCGCWSSCFPKISFFRFNSRILERQRAEEHLRQLQRERREKERELEDIKKDIRRLNNEEWELEERRRRQREMERQEERRERAEQKKWMERMRVSQKERRKLETLQELEKHLQLSELRALERESRRSERERNRKMDALQQPWTGAVQKDLRTSHSYMEMQRNLQENVMELQIKDVQLMLGTGDVQEDRYITSLEEMVRQNDAEILQCKERQEELEQEVENMRRRVFRRAQREETKTDVERESLLLLQRLQKEKQMKDLRWKEREEELKRELEELKQENASMEESSEEEWLPEFRVQREIEGKKEMELDKELDEMKKRLSQEEQQREEDRRRERERLREKKREMDMRRKQEMLEELEKTHRKMEAQLEIEKKAAKEREMTMLEEMERQREEERQEMERKRKEKQIQMENEFQAWLKESEMERENQIKLKREQEEHQKQVEELLREMEKRMMKERESANRQEEKWREMMKKQEEELTNEEKNEAEEATSSQVDNPKQSVLQAFSRGTMVQCFVQRDRKDKSGSTYQMYRETEDGKKLLLVARSMKKNKTSSYVISVGESDEADSVVGTLRSNKKWTEFTLYDEVRDPGEINEPLLAEACMKELAAISYEKVLGFRRPQQMSVIMPGMDKNLQRCPVYVDTAEGSSLKKLQKNEDSKLITLEAKKPVWNSEIRACVLDFNGRVKQTSARNFQLVCPENTNELVMQFGRVDEDHFALDYNFPLCALQAFAIALSCFDEAPSGFFSSAASQGRVYPAGVRPYSSPSSKPLGRAR